jgi:predicted dienelactone hydrolase
MKTLKFQPSFLMVRRWGRALALNCLSTLIVTLPMRAAEKLYLTYGPLKFSLKVESLETFAKQGTINKDLAFYLGFASPEDRAEFRKALLKRADISPVILSRFFNSAIGEDILTRLGLLIAIEGGNNGKYALRAALIQAASDPQGLTLLTFLEKFPTNMQFQGELMLAFAQAVDRVTQGTEFFVQKMQQWTAEEAISQPPTNFAALPDIRKLGPHGVKEETWTLTDNSRNRKFYVLVYKPQRWRDGKTPVVILSHGLASRPEDFSDRAKHLASYGYVVAVPQHPGSDFQQAQALLGGYSRQIFDVNEFINRPKDISYVIDELQRRNQSEFEGRLDLESVGAYGHSFGGYTVLALAGAEIDFEHLAQDCSKQLGGLNTSLLLQCRALDLPRQTYSLRDRRVKAVIAANPINSSIFGPHGLGKIQVPVMIGAGSYDPAAPVVFEQARSFPWLKTPNKYLMMSEGQAHVDFSELDAGITGTIESVGDLTLPSPDLLSGYADGMTLAFFEIYTASNADYRLYLQASYAKYLSQGQTFSLDFISAASADKLAAALQQLKEENE